MRNKEQRTILKARQENKVLKRRHKADQIELGPYVKLTVKLSLCARDSSHMRNAGARTADLPSLEERVLSSSRKY